MLDTGGNLSFPTPTLQDLDICGLMQINVYLMPIVAYADGKPHQKFPAVME